MAVGLPKALGSAVGGAVLGVCIREDPDASNYVVGVLPLAPLVVGTVLLLAFHERNERDRGHESLYAPPPAKKRGLERTRAVIGVTEQVAP